MDISGILTIVIIILVLSMAFALLKKLIKWFFIINILAVILLVIFSYIVYNDAKDFQEKFPEYEKLFLLDKGGEIIAGFEGVMTSEEGDVDFLTAQDLPSDYTQKEIVEKYYKVFIIKQEAFNFLDQVNFAGDDLPVSFVYELLMSADPVGLYAEEISSGVPGSTPELIKESMAGTEPMFKSQLFATLTGEAMQQKGPQFILEGLKQKTITVYPETIIFKIIKKAPKFLTDRLGTVVAP